MSWHARRLGILAAALVVLADPGAAGAGAKMYTATLSIHAFGTGTLFTAFPLGFDCNPYYGPSTATCGLGTLQLGAPLLGSGTLSTTAAGFSLPASELSRVASGSLASFFPYVYSYTYADLKNQTGFFAASGGPGSFSLPAQGPRGLARVAVQAGPGRFGGTMQLLGSLHARSAYYRNGGFSKGTSNWLFDLVGASAMTSMGAITGGYTAFSTTVFYHTKLLQTTTQMVTGSAFPWTTGTATVTATGGGATSILQRQGYDSRTSMGQGTIQLVSPLLTHWVSASPTLSRATAAIAVLRIEFVGPPDLDSDDDGLLDAAETNTGIFVDANDTGSDPMNFDSDGDGLSDGAEVNGFGSDPNVSETVVVFSHLDDTDPTDPSESWSQVGTGSGVVAGPVTGDLGFDAWQVDDNLNAADTTLGYLKTPAATPGFGWVLRGRVRVMDLGPDPVSENASVHIEYSDGTTGYALNLRANEAGDPVAFLEGGGGSLVLTGLGDGYHLYELVFDPAAGPPSAGLFVNGVLRLDGYTGFPSSLTRVVWGSFQSLSTGEGRYNRVEWSTFDGSADRDRDGLSDAAEATQGTDPLDPDTDADGLGDGAEVALGTDPLDPDTDGDGVCDGSNQVGSCTAAGPDNCPFVSNPVQTNGDSVPEGNACQCGDVTNDGIIDLADRVSFQSWLVNATGGGTFEPMRCNVIGSSAASPPCDIADIYVLDRFLSGGPITIGTDCPAFGP